MCEFGFEVSDWQDRNIKTNQWLESFYQINGNGLGFKGKCGTN